MPKLNPEREATLKKHAVEQVLALLDVVPVRIELTEAEIAQIYTQAELQTDRLVGDEEVEFEPLERHKLHSQKALAFQLEVYRLYHKDLSLRAIAKALQRPLSSVQRALDAARELAGDRYRVTVNSRTVVFAEIEKCARCRKSQALWGGYCKTHDQQLADSTETVSEKKMADEAANRFTEYEDNYWNDQNGELQPGSPGKVTDLDS